MRRLTANCEDELAADCGLVSQVTPPPPGVDSSRFRDPHRVTLLVRVDAVRALTALEVMQPVATEERAGRDLLLGAPRPVVGLSCNAHASRQVGGESNRAGERELVSSHRDSVRPGYKE